MPDNDNSENFQGLDFDEKLEIEKLQATIRNMSNFSDDSEGFLSQSPKVLMEGGDYTVSGNSESEFDPYAEIEKPVARSSELKAKKYVVMINPDNIDFFDKIPMEERTDIFNKLLSKYRCDREGKKRKASLIKFTKHMFIGIMVVLISLPIMFIVVNKSIEMTINNYKDVQNNFEKLYESRNPARLNAVRRTVY